LSLEIVCLDDVCVGCDLSTGYRLRCAVDIKRLAHRVDSPQRKPMGNTAGERCRSNVADGVSVGSAILNGIKAWIEELRIVLVDDQITGETICILKDWQVMRGGSRVVDLRYQVARQLLLHADGPSFHLSHLIVEVEASKAGSLWHTIDQDAASRVESHTGRSFDGTDFSEARWWTTELEVRCYTGLTCVDRRRENVRQVARSRVGDVEVRRLIREHSRAGAQRCFSVAKNIPGKPHARGKVVDRVIQHIRPSVWSCRSYSA